MMEIIMKDVTMMEVTVVDLMLIPYHVKSVNAWTLQEEVLAVKKYFKTTESSYLNNDQKDFII